MARTKTTHGFAMGGRKGSPWESHRQNPKRGKKGKRKRNPGKAPKSWKPSDDEKALSLAEAMDILYKIEPKLVAFKPVIDQNMAALAPMLEPKLAKKNPVKVRAKARLNGHLPPLSDDQHLMVIKEIVEQIEGA